MDSQQVSLVDESTWRRLIIQALVLVISIGPQFSSPLAGSAQGAGWECPSPAAVDATPVGTPVATGHDPVAFPAEGGDLTVFAGASLTDAFEAIEQELEAAI